MVIRWFDDHITIDYEPDKDVKIEEFDISVIPEEYRIENYEDLLNAISMELINSDGTKIYLTYTKADVTVTMGIDNENHITKNIKLGDITAMLVTKTIDEGMNILIWRDEGYLYDISSYYATTEELITLAKKIIKKQDFKNK